MVEAMEVLVAGYSEKELGVLADFFTKASILWKNERRKLLMRHGERSQIRNGLSKHD
jgi:hypothetical protein